MNKRQSSAGSTEERKSIADSDKGKEKDKGQLEKIPETQSIIHEDDDIDKEHGVKSVKDGTKEDLDVLNQKNKILKESGMLEAYEQKDFLRKLCKDGFPSGNIFEYAAQQMQNYEKKRKNDLLRKATMKNSVEDLHLNSKLRAQYGIQKDLKKKVQSPDEKHKDKGSLSPNKDHKKEERNQSQDDIKVEKVQKDDIKDVKSKDPPPKDTKPQPKKAAKK